MQCFPHTFQCWEVSSTVCSWWKFSCCLSVSSYFHVWSSLCQSKQCFTTLKLVHCGNYSTELQKGPFSAEWGWLHGKPVQPKAASNSHPYLMLQSLPPAGRCWSQPENGTVTEAREAEAGRRVAEACAFLLCSFGEPLRFEWYPHGPVVQDVRPSNSQTDGGVAVFLPDGAEEKRRHERGGGAGIRQRLPRGSWSHRWWVSVLCLKDHFPPCGLKKNLINQKQPF